MGRIRLFPLLFQNGCSQSSRFLPQARRIVGSGDENEKNPVKCNACAVARKIETDCFCRNLPISNDPVVTISRDLAKNSSQTTRMTDHEKVRILTQGIFSTTENDLRRITKIAYVKILLEQC